MGYRRRVSVGQRIRQLRTSKGLSQNALDRLTGFSDGTTSRLERGERGGKGGLKAATVSRYARALEVQPNELLGEGAAFAEVADERDQAVQIARADGSISEETIAYVMAMPEDYARSTLDWIRLLITKDALDKMHAAKKPETGT